MTASRVVRHRIPKPTPMRTLRIGEAARLGLAPALPFPGLPAPPADGGRRRRVASALSALVHAAAIGVLLAVAVLNPPVKEEVVPVQILREKPAPPPAPKPKIEAKREEPKPPPPKPVVAKAPAPTPAPAPKPAPAPPAPAPKALAERRSPTFNPSAQTVTPQVVNPSVIAKAAPVAAERIEMNTVQSVAAPKQISRSATSVETVSAVPSVAAAAVSKVDLGAAGGPALRGSADGAGGAAGPSVGPKAVATGGKSVGTGAVDLGDGSSVREGIASNRDVLGSPDGPQLANVNTRVGTGNLKGPGGEGTTLGGNVSATECDARPEVQAYLAQVKDRTLARWVSPPDTPSGSRATLSFQLDVGGSASRVAIVNSANPKIGASVVEAMRSASPFPPMSDRVRCLAGRVMKGIFSLNPSG